MLKVLGALLVILVLVGTLGRLLEPEKKHAVAYPPEGADKHEFNGMLAARSNARAYHARWVGPYTLAVTVTARSVNEGDLAREICEAALQASGKMELKVRLADHQTGRAVGATTCKYRR